MIVNLMNADCLRFLYVFGGMWVATVLKYDQDDQVVPIRLLAQLNSIELGKRIDH